MPVCMNTIDYNRAIRDIATSSDWQSGQLSRQMGRLAEVAAGYMEVGRVGVWRLQADHQVLDCVCQFDSRNGLIEPAQSLSGSQYPAYFAALADNHTLAVSDALHDPVTAELAERYLKPQKITSLLSAPIWLDGEMVGVVCHEHVGDPRAWRDEDQAFAGSMGDFAAMALSQDRYQRVEAGRERLTRIVEATPDMVAILAPSGQLIQLNPAGRKLLGLSEQADISGYRRRDLWGEQTTTLLETEILPALRGAGRWTGEAVLHEDTAHAVPVSVVALAHHDAQGSPEYFSLTLRDLTAQKAIQRELEVRCKLRTQALEHANRNLASFAYSVSHDLKAPLRGIEGYSRLLLTEYRSSLPAEAGECVDSIVAASQRMGQMMEDILAYSYVQMRQLKPVRTEVKKLVQQVVSEFDSQLRDGVELELDIEAGMLECDREGLVQILRNFVSNALKFSRNGPPARIHIEGRRHARGYRFAVNDNGVGFDMRFHDRIFELFYRLPSEDEQGGSGIGLALSARAAERLDGRVWAESTPGQGATFFLELNSGMQA